LRPQLFSFSAAPAQASGLQLLNDVAIAIPGQAGFGGLSAIEMDGNGRALLSCRIAPGSSPCLSHGTRAA
jgi:hypothetical protein